jgi:hypothetical protein
MPTLHRFGPLSVFALTLAVACEGDKAAAEAEGPMDPPFEVKIHKVEMLDEVAPTKTHLENGLGSKAKPGDTFVCVQYDVTNKGGAEDKTAGAEGRLQVKVSAFPPAKMLDAAGAEIDFDLGATSNYQPSDWKNEHGTIEKGQTAKKNNCFPVAKDNTKDLKLFFSKRVDKQTWELKVPLPATG